MGNRAQVPAAVINDAAVSSARRVFPTVYRGSRQEIGRASLRRENPTPPTLCERHAGKPGASSDEASAFPDASSCNACDAPELCRRIFRHTVLSMRWGSAGVSPSTCRIFRRWSTGVTRDAPELCRRIADAPEPSRACGPAHAKPRANRHSRAKLAGARGAARSCAGCPDVRPPVAVALCWGNPREPVALARETRRLWPTQTIFDLTPQRSLFSFPA